MKARLILDKAGRVVIPKTLRDELDLGAGDALQLDTEGERMVLRPVRGAMPLQREHGIWVFRTGKPLPAAVSTQVLEDLRTTRDRQHSRKAR